MGLKKSLSHRGLSVPQGYIRVDRISGGKLIGFNVEAGIYSDKNQPQPLDVVSTAFEFVPGSDIYSQAYEALKLLPQFSGALDD